MAKQKPKLSIEELMAIARGEVEFAVHEKDCGDYIMQTTNKGERMIRKTDR